MGKKRAFPKNIAAASQPTSAARKVRKINADGDSEVIETKVKKVAAKKPKKP